MGMGAKPCSAHLIIPITCLVIIYQQHSENLCASEQQNTLRCLLVKQGCHFKMDQKKIGTFNLAFHNDILKQSFAKLSVQYVFLSLLLQRMQRWARQCDQNEVISTLLMASQQLTTLPMIRRHVEILLSVKRKRRVTPVTRVLHTPQA